MAIAGRQDAVLEVGINQTSLERQLLESFKKSEKELSKVLSQIRISSPKEAVAGFRDLNTRAHEFERTLESVNRKVLAFGVSFGVIATIEKGFLGLVKSTVDVEKSLTDINVILNASSKNLEKFGSQLFDVAKNTGQSFDTVAKAATEFARQGLGAEETLKRTKDAMILTRLSGLDAAASVEALTATINSFSKSALTSTDILNKFANVDAAFAVSSADLAEALKRVGSTAQDVGVDISELVAMVTTAKQITGRDGAVIGNSFKTIFQRIQRPETLNFLEDLGVAVRDLSGEALSGKDILVNLGTTLENAARSGNDFSKVQKEQVVQLAAGVFQANIFRALLSDLGKKNGVYASSLKKANEETNSAIDRNEKLNTTLSSLFNETQNNFKQLGSAIGDVAIAPSLNSLLKGVNTLVSGAVDDSEGQKLGGKIGKGIVEGIGRFISGPGALLTGVILTRALSATVKYTKEALKDFSSLRSVSSDQNGILSARSGILDSLASKSKTELETQKQILGILTAQNTVKSGGAGVGSSSEKTFSPSKVAFEKIAGLGRIIPTSHREFDQSKLSVNPIGIGGVGKINKGLGSISEKILSGSYNLGSLTAAFNRSLKGLNLNEEQLKLITEVRKKVVQESLAELNLQRKINVERAAQLAQEAKLMQIRLLEAQAGGVLSGGAARKQLGLLNPESLTAINETRRGKLTRIGGTASIGVPIAAGIASQFIGDETVSSRNTQLGLGSVSETASLAGMGLAVAGPWGAMLGGIGGGIVSLTNAVKGWNNILPDLNKNIENLEEEINRISEGVANFARTTDLLENEDLKPRDRARLERERFNILSDTKFAPFKGDLMAAKDTDEILEIGKRATQLKQAQLSAAQTTKYIETAARESTLFSPMDFFETQGKTAMFAGIQTGNLNRKGQGFVGGLSDRLNQITGDVSGAGLNIMGLLAEDRDAEEQIQSFLSKNTEEGIIEGFSLAFEKIGRSTEGESVLETLTKLFQKTSDPSKRKILAKGIAERFSPEKVEEERGLRKRVGEIEKSGVNKLAELRANLFLSRIEKMTEGAVSQSTAQRRILMMESGLERTKLVSEAGLQRGADFNNPYYLLQRRGAIEAEQLQTQTKIDKLKAGGGLTRQLEEFGRPALDVISEDPRKFIGQAESIQATINAFSGKSKKISESITKGISTGTFSIEDTGLEIVEFIKEFDSLKSKIPQNVPKEILSSLESNIKGVLDSYEGFLTNLGVIGEQEKQNLENIKVKIQELTKDLEFDRGERLRERFKEGKISGLSYSGLVEKQADEKIKRGEGLSGKEITEVFTSRFAYNTQDAFSDLKDSAVDLADTMKSGFKDSFKAFADGSKTAEDAIRSLGLTIANKLLDRALDAGTNALFGGVFNLLGGAFGGFQNPLMSKSVVVKNSGGLIRGYASGGVVTGGSGVRDDVPAMLSAGSYVVKKSAVNKYGAGFLNSLGGAKGFAAGGVSYLGTNRFDYDSATRPTTGSAAFDPLLSDFALTDENNPQNAARMEKEGRMYQYVADLRNYEEQKRQAMAQYKRGLRQRRQAAYLNVGISAIGAGLGAASKGMKPANPNANTWSNSPYGRADGGYNTDKVPALLTMGEVVIPKQTVDKYGVNFFNQINSGKLSKFAEGGVVGGNTSTSINGFGGGNDMMNRLVQSIDMLNRSIGDKQSNAGGGRIELVVNNTINIDSKGNAEVTSEASSKNENGNTSKEMDKLQRFQQMVTTEVYRIANKEFRNGGLYSEEVKRIAGR